MEDESSRRPERLQVRAGEGVCREVESGASPHSLAGTQLQTDTQGAAQGQAKMQVKGLTENWCLMFTVPAAGRVASLGSSTKRLRKKCYQSHPHSSRKLKRGSTSQLILRGLHYPNTKTRQRHCKERNLKTEIRREYRC